MLIEVDDNRFCKEEQFMTEDSVSRKRRQSLRSAVSCVLTYSPFSSMCVPSIDAMVVNCSDHGLCFRSPYPLQKGQYIYIRARPIYSGYSGPTPGSRLAVPLRSQSLARVRWCLSEPLADTPAYSIGIEYL